VTHATNKVSQPSENVWGVAGANCASSEIKNKIDLTTNWKPTSSLTTLSSYVVVKGVDGGCCVFTQAPSEINIGATIFSSSLTTLATSFTVLSLVSLLHSNAVAEMALLPPALLLHSIAVVDDFVTAAE
jgi:hypothetical protein